MYNSNIVMSDNTPYTHNDSLVKEKVVFKKCIIIINTLMIEDYHTGTSGVSLNLQIFIIVIQIILHHMVFFPYISSNKMMYI